MKTDPIMAEVRAARDKLAARFDYDIAAIFRHIQAEEAKSSLSYLQCRPRTVAGEDEAKQRSEDADGRHVDEA